MSDHSHDSPSNLYLKKRHGTSETKALTERVNKIEQLLIEKGVVTKDALDRIIEIYESDIGPLNGAKVVAKAWSNNDYKLDLMNDPTTAIAKLGYSGLQGEHMVVVENTPSVHNVVVCTLCSCYPWPVLGLPPQWYKEAPYRSRIVIEPREVLKEFGTNVPETTEIRVWDSSAEIRYMVLPQRPIYTNNMSEEELISIVTRDSMIGVEIL